MLGSAVVTRAVLSFALDGCLFRFDDTTAMRPRGQTPMTDMLWKNDVGVGCAICMYRKLKARVLMQFDKGACMGMANETSSLLIR